MIRLPLRGRAACMAVALTALLLAACGPKTQGMNDVFNLPSAEGVTSRIYETTVKQISARMPEVGVAAEVETEVGDTWLVPTATPLAAGFFKWAFGEEDSLLPTVTPTPLRTAASGWGVITSYHLNVRASPDINGNVVTSLGYQDCVAIQENRDGWYRIDVSDGKTGWSHGDFIQTASECPVPSPVDTTAAAGVQSVSYTATDAEAESEQPVSSSSPPLVPNAKIVGSANIHECFGGGLDEIRNVPANTPVQVLGKGPFAPPGNQRGELGPEPYLKIRIWDGQYAWVSAEAVDVNVNEVADVSGQCEEHERIDWTKIVRPTPIPAPRPTPAPYSPYSPNTPYRPPQYTQSQYNTSRFQAPISFQQAIGNDSRPTYYTEPSPSYSHDHKWRDE